MSSSAKLVVSICQSCWAGQIGYCHLRMPVMFFLALEFATRGWFNVLIPPPHPTPDTKKGFAKLLKSTITGKTRPLGEIMR